MPVAELEAYHVRLPLRRPVRHASHARTDTDNLLVRCRLADGTTGWGEGVPRDYVTGETIDTALAHLKRSELAAQLEPCDSFGAAVAMCERLRLAPVPGDDRACGGNAARCAVELALLDAYGRRFGESLSHVTKLIAPDLYDPRPRVQYSGVILSARGWKARVAAVGQRIYGFNAIKVKVGIAGQDDGRRLRVIRRCTGPGIDLRIDANEAWPAGEVADRLAELAPARVSSVEQPVRHEDVACLAAVRKRSPVPVLLDESLCSMADAAAAHDNGWCDGFNLRLSKCGGFIPTLRLAQYAATHGLKYQLGCQVGETGVLSAAGRHFATSVAGILHREGSFDRRLLADWLTAEDVTFGRGGFAPWLTTPGLSVTPDPTRVAIHTARREVLLGGG